MAGATTWPSRKTAFSTEANSGSARRASATLNEGSGFLIPRNVDDYQQFLEAFPRIGSLAVMEGDELVGIITERHYARNVVLKGKASPATPVRDIDRRRRALVGGAPRSFAPSLTLRALLQSLQLSAPKADARLSTPSKEVILVWRHGMDEADGWISRQDWRRGWPCRISRESRHYASL